MDKTNADFQIEIDFKKGEGNPSRVFRAMSDLIDAFQDADRILLKSLDLKIEPVLLLEDIETGSIKAWFRQALDSIDDKALESGDVKKVIGSYLVKGKYALINFLDKKTDITNAEDLSHLQTALTDLINETDVKMLPAYTPPSREEIVRSLDKINNALAPLNDNDKAIFVSSEGSTEFNLTLYIAPETIQDLITAEKVEYVATLIMKVKKPDFLGHSQWEFRFDNRNISASIADAEWLGLFQNGRIQIAPGDAIRARVLIQVYYGFERDVEATHYTVVEIIETIKKEEPFQARLFPSNE